MKLEDVIDPGLKEDLQSFMQKNEDRLKMWAKDHERELPPIRQVEGKKEFVWLNREQRRKLEKKINER